MLRPRRVAPWLVVGLVLSAWMPATARGQEYTIGLGDVLTITVWGQADLSRDYTVDPDGAAPFPLIGRIMAVGRSPKELAAHLTEVLGKDYLVNPQVSVTVKEYLSQKVQVLGAAERPGVYYLTGPTSLLDILSKAGGFASTAGKQVLLVRNHGASDSPGSVLRLNLDKIQAGDVSENARVRSQDIVIVSKAQEYSYFVFGEVTKPGAYRLDKETSILEGITVAGWFTDKAAPGRTRVIRSTPQGQQVIEVDMNDILQRGREAKSVMLQESDVVMVSKAQEYSYFVFGEVRKPGAYRFDKETNILEGITMAGGFTDKAAPSRTRVIRSTPQGQQVIQVDMNDILRRGREAKSVILQESDVVVVPESFF